MSEGALGFAVLFNIQQRLAVYSTFIRTAFLKMLAYRLRYFVGIITYLLFVTVHYFIWQAVFSNHQPGATINGFTLAEMITYISVGWVARSLYFSNIDVEMNQMVLSGEISNSLIQPVNFRLMMLTQAAGESLFRLVFFTWPIAIVLLLLYPIMPPASMLAGVLFLVSTVFSFLIFAEINFIIGVMAFYLKSIDGVMRAKYFLIQLLSGLILPISFYPEWLQLIFDYLPFKIIAYVPLQLYLGKIPNNQLPVVFFNQILWWLLLFVLGRWLWSRAIARLTVQGG